MTDTVVEVLKSKGVAFNVSGKDYVIHCLNPDHDDSSPSMRVDKITGIYHCFSCGHKGNLFKHYGLTADNTHIRIAKLKQKLADVRIDFEGQPIPEGSTAFTENYRHISKETYIAFEAFINVSHDKLVDRLVIPIKDIRGKTLVYQARHMHSAGNPKYINYPEGIELPIYPVVYPNRPRTAIFVEGIFDMLNCYDKGLTNVSCVFGTNTLQKDMGAKLLPLKTQGIQKIFLMFDGDTPGNDAAAKLKPLIEEHQFQVEIIKLPDGMDPGEMDQEYIDSIKEYAS